MPQLAEASRPAIALQTANPADRVALRGVRLAARVAGLSLKATLEQTFVNLEDRAIEAVYTFPLPESAAVCGFEVVFFDRVFTGVVDESDRAIERYDDAIAEGHGAYLLEQHRPDVFTVRVGNLKPRQAVTVRLKYVADVQIVDRQIRLSFPTTIAPRYQTTSGTDPIDAAIDGDALNPPHVLSVPYGLTMDVEIDLDKNLTDIGSPSHAITVVRADREGEAPSEPRSRHARRVTFAGGVEEMNRDVVLTLSLAKEQEPFALAATSPQGERFVALNFVPEFTEDDALAHATRSETIFLLDCSGSMEGDSIAQATAALECCLRSMSAGDTFNVCRFGSTYELLSTWPLVYSKETLDRALKFVRQGANLGGTELLEPLQAILVNNPQYRGERPPVRNLVLLTDGQVTNEPAILALAKRHRARNRLFTFGIGPAASAFLVSGLARVTGGAAEFIAPGERIEEKVLRTFGRLASPPVTDVEIDWGNADPEAAPRTLPPLFDGDALRVFARVGGAGRLPETVTLKCNTPAGPRSWAVPVRQAEDPANVLPTLWARAMIRTLEEEAGVQQTASISAPSRESSRLIDLSKRYNLLCSLTSFIAVEHRNLEDRNTGQPATRRIPTQLALGWGGVEAEQAGAPCCLDKTLDMTCAPPAAAAGAAAPFARRARRTMRAGPMQGLFGKLKEALGGGGDVARHLAAPSPKQDAGFGIDLDALRDADHDASATYAREDVTSFATPPRVPEANRPGDDPLIHLLGHQIADGSFDDSATVEHTLRAANLDRKAVQDAIDPILHDAHVPAAVRAKVRHTLLVLLVLRLRFPDRQPIWSRAAKKALRYITDAAQLHGHQADQWLTDLTNRFSATPA